MNTAHELSARLADLLAREHHAMADFLVALADFDQKRAWVELGHNSLFSFLRRDLHLSAGAAQYRKTASELVQRFPEVLAALRDGKLCLSSVTSLAKVVNPENVSELLPRFFGLSARDAEALAVSIRPVEDPPRRGVVTPIRLPATEPARALEVRTSEVEDRVASPAAPQPPAALVASPPRTREVEPLDTDRARFHLTVSKKFLEKLQATKDALSHSRPGASSEEALEACMDLMLKQQAKRRGIVDRPRKRTPGPTATADPTSTSTSTSNPTSIPSSTRYIPAEVRRAVWLRDQGSCSPALGTTTSPRGRTTATYAWIGSRTARGASRAKPVKRELVPRLGRVRRRVRVASGVREPRCWTTSSVDALRAPHVARLVRAARREAATFPPRAGSASPRT